MRPARLSRRSIQPARVLGQHDRDAIADRIGKLGGAGNELLPFRIVFERPLGEGADEDFEELGIDAAGGLLRAHEGNSNGGVAGSIATPGRGVRPWMRAFGRVRAVVSSGTTRICN